MPKSFFTTSEEELCAAAGIKLEPGTKLSPDQRAQLRKQALAHWALIIGPTQPIPPMLAYECFFTRACYRALLKQYFASELMQACKGHEAETFMGSLLFNTMANLAADYMPLIRRLAAKLKANHVL